MSRTTKFGANARVQVIAKGHPHYARTGIVIDIGMDDKTAEFLYVVQIVDNYKKTVCRDIFPESALDRPSIILLPRDF